MSEYVLIVVICFDANYYLAVQNDNHICLSILFAPPEPPTETRHQQSMSPNLFESGLMRCCVSVLGTLIFPYRILTSTSVLVVENVTSQEKLNLPKTTGYALYCYNATPRSLL